MIACVDQLSVARRLDLCNFRVARTLGGMSQPIADDPTVSRVLERPPAEVWKQLTSPDGFEHWMGPGSTIEPEPDGQLIAADPESGEPKTGRVLEIEPDHVLRWVWRPLGDDPKTSKTTEVLVELEPTENPMPGTATPGTVITVTERPSTLVVSPVGVLASTAVGCGR